MDFFLKLTYLKTIEFGVILYHSIALEELYKTSFEFKVIWWSVRPQIHENWAGSERPLPCPPSFYEIAAKVTIKSNCTQKGFYRRLQPLSADIKLNKIRLAHSSLKVVQTLEDTNQLQDSILEAQKKSLAQQEQLLQSSSMLSQALDGSKEDVRDMLEEFRY